MPKRKVDVIVPVACKCGSAGVLKNPSKFWLAWHARNGWRCKCCKFAFKGREWRAAR